MLKGKFPNEFWYVTGLQYEQLCMASESKPILIKENWWQLSGFIELSLIPGAEVPCSLPLLEQDGMCRIIITL